MLPTRSKPLGKAGPGILPNGASRVARPFYETLAPHRFILQIGLATMAVSLWFMTLATFRVSNFPPDSLYFVRSLPAAYWGGVIATILLLGTRKYVEGRTRTTLEVSSLFLLALYLLGLPSFAYETPRILDSYQHTGNTLGMINYQGWYESPIWYLRQFPGAYTLFAQLVSVAGIDPFLLMKFYVVGVSWIVLLFVYVIARTLNPNLSAVASGVFLGGMWFQLHVSPQSLALVPYHGLLFVLLKLVTDKAREAKWIVVAVASAPSFVASHPETPIITLLGVSAFFVIALLRSRVMFKQYIPTAGLFLLSLSASFTLWWGSFASETRRFVINTVLLRALEDLSKLSTIPTGIPSTPSPDYLITIRLEQAVSATVWLLGAALLLFFRRFQAREVLFAGFFLAGVSTIPVAFFSKADVLQRSYLFSLIPAVLLAASLIGRRNAFSIRGRSISSVARLILILLMIIFSLIIPITRYGIDPSDYVPQSSLFAVSNVAGSLDHSVLFLHPGEYGWRFEAAVAGDFRGPRLEQSDIANKTGGFIKPTSVLDEFNLTFTGADGSSDYIVVSDHYVNLWLLRFGPRSAEYVQPWILFEQSATLGTQLTKPFNLVYSTGTDRIYSNRTT